MNAKMSTNESYVEAFKGFTRDLDNSCTDEDRRDAVQYYANKVGVNLANQAAEKFGLGSSYYKAKCVIEFKA